MPTLAALPPLTVYSTRSHHKLWLDVLGAPAYVVCTVDEHLDLANGDHTLAVSVDEIVTPSGQTIFPKMIDVTAFRKLISAIQIHCLNPS